MGHSLRFSPQILRRIGEELVQHPDYGVMELVRNAYDADARNCHIRLADAAEPGGSLRVVDDGDGMTAEDLALSFLLIGSSVKTHDGARYTRSGRRKVGEKGLGRISALRLGHRVSVRTKPRSEPGAEYALDIDWDRIDQAQAVEDVLHEVRRTETTEAPGTEIVVHDLRKGFAEAHASRLARGLLLVSGPPTRATTFRITCDAPGFAALERDVMSPWEQFTEAVEFRLVAELDENGQARATLYNWRGEPEYQGDHSDVGRGRTRDARGKPPVLQFQAPAAFLEVWTFNLNPGASAELRHVQQDTEGLKSWLRQVGGIHLFHRGLRVQPYGDRGDDWLAINVRRAGSPEGRPSTNNSFGGIWVEDPGDVLRPKTDRSGFVDDVAFLELQAFARHALDWAAEKRLDRREARRVGKVRKTRDKAEAAEEELNRVLEAASDRAPTLFDNEAAPSDVARIKIAARDLVATKQEEIQALREDLLLYRTLATVGTSTAVFAHESIKPAARIVTLLKSVRTRLQRVITGEDYEAGFANPIESSISSAETVNTFARLPLDLLAKRKRRAEDVDVDVACRETVQLFMPYLRLGRIDVQLDLDAQQSAVRTTVADVESIVSNLLANAAHAFTREDESDRDRIIRISTRREGAVVALSVHDSGPGIRGLKVHEIWQPGRTTRDNGTGLGLTIVRDIVADLNGSHIAQETGELGGASILIELPATDVVDTDT
ncbi:ATP-binding protein [Embleya sp. NPDC005971]|uniref:sensor histidine kinase n=1 Tax=Embleya sp. NPDC005971 TaxID=3156724 RepID=UPI0033CBE13A